MKFSTPANLFRQAVAALVLITSTPVSANDAIFLVLKQRTATGCQFGPNKPLPANAIGPFTAEVATLPRLDKNRNPVKANEVTLQFKNYAINVVPGKPPFVHATDPAHPLAPKAQTFPADKATELARQLLHTCRAQ